MSYWYFISRSLNARVIIFVGDHKKGIGGKNLIFIELGAGSHRPKFSLSLTLAILASSMLRQAAI